MWLPVDGACEAGARCVTEAVAGGVLPQEPELVSLRLVLSLIDSLVYQRGSR